MTFTRIRTIKGIQYIYEETRWREGKKVRSRSRSLGRFLGSLIKVPEGMEGMRQLERQGEAADAYREKLAADRAHLASLEKLGRELAREFEKEAASKSEAAKEAQPASNDQVSTPSAENSGQKL